MSDIDLNRLIRTFEPNLRVGLETGASIAARHRHPVVEVAHWLRALLDIAEYGEIFEELSVSAQAVRTELDAAIADMSGPEAGALTLSQNLLMLAREAWLIASLQCGRSEIMLPDLLAALIGEPTLRVVVRGIAPSLRGLDKTALDRVLKTAAARSPEQSKSAMPASTLSPADNEFLRLYTRDMTADAREGRIDPVIGRDAELRQVVDILMRRRQNNPILIGEAGVGKTAVAEAFALEIAAGSVPERLKQVRLLLLDLSLLQAGAGVKGEFERRLHGVVDAVRASPDPVILFIDEAHGLIGAGGQAGQGDAANILKPALARGELRTIAATTWSEYKRFIEKDAALTRRFQTVLVAEPDEPTAIRMLRGVAENLKKHHQVRIRDEALVAAVRLSARYMPARQLPDKAISLIDTAAAAVALSRQSVPEALKQLTTESELLAREADWLKSEPETQRTRERLAEIDTERASLVRETEALKTKLEEEMRLAREADRLEAVFSQAGEVLSFDAGAGEADEAEAGANVAPFPAQHMNPENARAALSATEQSLSAVAGETPLVPRVVDKDVVAAVVARWTGIPVGKLLSDQVETVKSLDARLKEKVLGQDAAIERIASAMRAARAGLSDPRRPPAVFLLVGMSGTGKTETALSLADMLYGGPQHLTTINMSEFKEEHKISMLLGSPPGYVGYGEGGVLTEAVRRRPYGVLLLDEIDKAHPGVQEIFYQVFDKGVLRDGEGRDIDFKNTTIFMTANTGSELLASLAADPDTMPEGEALEALLLPELQKQFKPAFLGRTMILPFMPLGTESLAGIVDMQIDRIRQRISAAYGTAVSLSPEARNALVARAKTSEMGARAIEIMIARDLLPVLSTFFLDSVAAGRKTASITIHYQDHAFSVGTEEAPVQSQFVSPEDNREADENPRDTREACSGRTGKRTVIHLVTTGNPGETYIEYTLTNTLIASYSIDSNGDRPIETIKLNFTKLEVKYTPFDENQRRLSMSNADIGKVALTDYNLIVEEVFDESVFGMVAPSQKIGGLKVVGTSHLQVIRRIFTLTMGEDVYFKGRKIQGMPGAGEWLSELLEPGRQITTRANGKTGILNRYVGKKNIFSAKALEHYKKSVTLPFLRIYGEDPAPTRLLYGNPAVTFLQKTGERPVAAAYFNSRTNRLDLLHHFDRRTVLDNFAKHFAQALLGCGAELLGAGALLAAPEPTMLTKAGGAALGAHGVDQCIAGGRQVWTGRDVRSFADRGASALARSLGASPGAARNVGLAAEILVPVGGAILANAVRTGAIRGGRIVLMRHEAVNQASRVGGHTIARHVGRTEAELRARIAATASARRPPPVISTFDDLATAERAITRGLQADSVPEAISIFAQKADQATREGVRDVYALPMGDESSHLKIQGAGVYSDDAAGLGYVNAIAWVDDALFVTGYHSQLYRLTADHANWFNKDKLPVAPETYDYLVFGDIGGTSASDLYMTVTYSPTSTSRELTDEEQERMGRLYLEGRNEEAYAIREAAEGASRVIEGRFYHWNGDEWRVVATPRSGRYYPEPATLSDIFIETEDRIWTVGNNGVILLGNAKQGFQDVSFKGNDENLRSITKFKDRMVIASDYALHWFDGHILSPLKPVLDPSINKNVPTPLKVQGVGDVLYYFDYKHGVFTFDGHQWTEIVIPPQLLEREFKGLPQRD
eukprot:g9873.t1